MACWNVRTHALKVALLALLSFPLFGTPQAPSQPSSPHAGTEPGTTQPTQDSGVQNRVSPGDSQASQKGTNNGQTPIPQKDRPNIKRGSKADVGAIGNRGVGKGVNFYSLEREMAMGKSLAQEVEQSSKLIDDQVVTEYVNR